MIDLKGVRALLVDDDPEWLSNLKEFLELAQIEVLTAKDGEEGFKVRGQFRPDLVLTDTNMPNLDGVELLRRIRSSGDLTPIVVFFSSSTRGYSAESILKDGANAVLRKLDSQDHLMKVITGIVKKS